MEAGFCVGPYRTHAQPSVPGPAPFDELLDSPKLGEGAGCVGVYAAVDTRDGRQVAVKTVDRTREMDSTWKHSFQRELDIAIKLQHPNVIEIYDVIFWDRYVCLVMEYASGGELFTQVANGGPMSEERARQYFKQIVSAASHCHSQGICHRDLKLENILLGADQAHIKITDFGLSKDTEQHSQPKTKRVGTISYMAPEVAMASGEMPYSGEGADVWSLGIILYVLVCCEYPFGFDGAGGQPTQRVLARIKEGAFTFPTDKVPLSPEIMSLITGILTVDLDARFKISDIVAHPWFTAGDVYAPEGGATDRSIAWELAPELPNVPSIESVEFEFDSDDGGGLGLGGMDEDDDGMVAPPSIGGGSDAEIAGGGGGGQAAVDGSWQ